MESNPILDKLKKLLALQKSAEGIGSLEEAANAAMKIQAHLIKYNLEMADVESHEGKKKSDITKESLTGVVTKKNESDWIINLYSKVAQFNFGFVVTTSRHDHATGRKYKYVNLVGTKENIDVITFMCSQLEYQVRNLEEKSWRENRDCGSKRNSYRRAYFDGAVVGIGHKLSEAQRLAMSQNNTITALVVDHSKRIKDELPNLFQSLRYTKDNSRAKKDITAGMNGYRDGKSINIHSGVGGATQQKHIG